MWTFNDLHYLTMSCIILPLCIILPPYHFTPVSFCPYHFAPWKSFNDLHYLPMSRIILPPWIHFAPSPWKSLNVHYEYLPISCIILPPGNCFMIYTIYPCPVSFCPLDSFCPHIILPPRNGLMIYTIYSCPVSFCHCIRLLFLTNKKPFTTKAYDRHASGDCGTSGYIILKFLKETH